jgi:hypothetical protein
MLHAGTADAPQPGTTIVKVKLVPESVPVKVPLNCTVPAGVAPDMVPMTNEPDCVRIHDIIPGPEESEPLPE